MLWWRLLLLGVEGGCILGMVACDGARGALAYQGGQRDGLAVLWSEGKVMRMRGVGVIWSAVGLRVSLVLGVSQVLGVLVRDCHSVWVKRWGFHPRVQGWERMSHWQDWLGGHTLLHGHGHQNRRGGGGRRCLIVHLLQMRGRPGAMFRGEDDVLLLELLLMMQVADCGGRRQGDLTDLSALGVHSGLDGGKC